MPLLHTLTPLRLAIHRGVSTLRARLLRFHHQYGLKATCALCGLDGAGKSRLCGNCLADLSQNHTACIACALPLPPLPTDTEPANHRLCHECQIQRVFDGAFIPYQYQPPIPFAIRQFKQHQDWLHGDSLLALLNRAWRETPPEWQADLDVIVPVPMHWQRLWQRGFNQSDVIAQALSRLLQLPVQSLFIRTQASPKQQLLKRQQRLVNLSHTLAFRPSRRPLNNILIGKCVLLVDDVVTTGATLHALAQHCRDAGAERVYISAIARTPKSPEK